MNENVSSNNVNSSQKPANLPEIDHFTKTPEAKALFNIHRRNKAIRSNNKLGKNQWSFEKTITPYSLKYSIAQALLNNNKSLEYIKSYTGLCYQTINRIKKGHIKLLNEVVEVIKRDEQNKLVFLGNEILDRVSEKDIESASLLQKTTSYCQLLDKRRLLAGESTENVNHLAKLDVLVNSAKRADNMLDKLESVDNK